MTSWPSLRERSPEATSSRRWNNSRPSSALVRKGRWKFHYYVHHAPELFDLDHDPDELHDLSGSADHQDVLRDMEAELRSICDPEAVDAPGQTRPVAVHRVARRPGRGRQHRRAQSDATTTAAPA